MGLKQKLKLVASLIPILVIINCNNQNSSNSRIKTIDRFQLNNDRLLVKLKEYSDKNNIKNSLLILTFSREEDTSIYDIKPINHPVELFPSEINPIHSICSFNTNRKL